MKIELYNKALPLFHLLHHTTPAFRQFDYELINIAASNLI